MIVPRLIELKRDGGELSAGQWGELIAGMLRGDVPDYQMSALLMAIYFRGMSDVETFALTRVMVESGARLPRSGMAGHRVDKHSTGGVGDKVSLVLAPLVSSLGITVPMMSGRGLGHTGGTLDKLESIPGFRTRLPLDEAEALLQQNGCVMIGQSAEIAPADGRLYSLRDATATVESIPLLAASIMSKKLAESLDGLVLDVKYGSGAFLPEKSRGAELARLMMAIGEDSGCHTVALQTSMETPLGRAIGNSLEVEEALLTLQGDEGTPADLLDVTLALGAEMLMLAGVASDAAHAMRMQRDAISSGSASRQFARIIESQGGNPAVVDDPALLPQAAECEVFRAPRKGSVSAVEPRGLGHALIEMRGGRSKMDDIIDPSAGFMISVRPGDWVDEGEAIASVFAADMDGVRKGMRALASAVRIGEPVS